MTTFSYEFKLRRDKYCKDPETGEEIVDLSPDYQGRVKAESIHEAFAKSIAKAFGKKHGWFPDQQNMVDDNSLIARGSLTEYCAKANASAVVSGLMTAVIARA